MKKSILIAVVFCFFLSINSANTEVSANSASFTNSQSEVIATSSFIIEWNMFAMYYGTPYNRPYALYEIQCIGGVVDVNVEFVNDMVYVWLKIAAINQYEADPVIEAVQIAIDREYGIYTFVWNQFF